MSMQLVDENALDADERWPDGTPLALTKEEFDRLDNKARRRLAAYVRSNAVNGKSTSLETASFFVCQRTLGDYE